MAKYPVKDQGTKLRQVQFRGKRGGTFVDIGAHDGVSINNTLVFERKYGWTGLCVEANPNVFPRLVRNRKTTCLNVAVADREGSARFHAIRGPAEMSSGLADGVADRHVKKMDAAVARHGGTVSIVDVPVRRLDALCADHDISEVHLLSVDTEGSEPEILRSIGGFKIHVVVAECSHEDDLPGLIEALGGDFQFVVRWYIDAFFINRTSRLASRAMAMRAWTYAWRAERKAFRLIGRR